VVTIICLTVPSWKGYTGAKGGDVANKVFLKGVHVTGRAVIADVMIDLDEIRKAELPLKDRSIDEDRPTDKASLSLNVSGMSNAFIVKGSQGEKLWNDRLLSISNFIHIGLPHHPTTLLNPAMVIAAIRIEQGDVHVYNKDGTVDTYKAGDPNTDRVWSALSDSASRI